jgi:hypothetical protein
MTYFLVVIDWIKTFKSTPRTLAANKRVYLDSADGPAALSEISPNSTFPRCSMATTASRQVYISSSENCTFFMHYIVNSKSSASFTSTIEKQSL